MYVQLYYVLALLQSKTKSVYMYVVHESTRNKCAYDVFQCFMTNVELTIVQLTENEIN